MNFVMVTVRLFLLTRMIIHLVFGQTCSSNNDCKTCGVCIDKNPSNTKCFYPYPRTKVKKNKCYFKQDMCDGYLCQNEGKCHIEFGFSRPVCKCDYNKYFMGSQCEIEWDKSFNASWVSGVAVLYDKPKEISKSLYFLDLYAAVYSAAVDLRFYLETSEGFAIRFNNYSQCSIVKNKLLYPYHPLCQSCSAILPDCEIVYQVTVQFPYKLALGPDMITRSGVVIGYMANITLAAKVLNKRKFREVYRIIHPIMVNYEDLQPDQREHMPIIELQNCGRTPEERIVYLMRSTVSLKAKVKDTPRDSVLSIWGMWELGKFRDNYNRNPQFYQIDDGYSWTLEPFSLKMKIYRVELQVTITFAGFKSVANFAECYIEVVNSETVAIISGGSKITVSRTSRVVISGVQSYNPDKVTTNQDLRFSWQCSPNCDSFIRELAYGQIMIPSNILELGKTYNISLTVSDRGCKDGMAFQEVYVGLSNEDMSVYCIMNCLAKVVPFDPLLLEVRLPNNAQKLRVFHWTITDKSGKVDADLWKCKNKTLPSYLFCVEPNVLNYSEVYHVNVEMVNSDAIASLKVQVGHIPNISCDVTPLKGILLKTSFSISCAMPKTKNTSWVFEFFDKFDSDSSGELSGRMIATNNQGILREFEITRGIIFVYLFDTIGLVSVWKQVIELTPYNVTRQNIDDLFVEIEYLIDSHERELALTKASLVSDLIGPGSDKSYIAEKMVYLLCKIPYLSQGIMKLGLVTITNFIISLTMGGGYKFNPGMLRSLAQLIHTLTHWTEFAMDLSHNAIPSITNRMLEQMATASIEAIEVLFANRNGSFFDTSLEDLKPSDYDEALEASQHTEAIISHIGRVLSFRQATGYSITSIASSKKQTLVMVVSDYLDLISNKTNTDKGFTLKMSQNLIKSLSSVKELTIQLTAIKYSPFWTGRRDISTNLLSLDLYDKSSLDSKLSRIGYINHEIDLTLDVLHPKIGSTTVVVTQIDPTSTGTESIDSQLTVLRLDLASHSKLFLSFSFQNSNDSIKIYVSDKMRPDFKLVNTSRTTISSSNANYETPIDVGDGEKFVYFGILPGSHVPINGSVHVTIHFHFRLCLTWLRHRWVSHYCRVSSNANISTIHCSCTHLSFFSAVFAVPPNEIDPFNDIHLFLTLKDNWFVVAFMACILLVFLLFGVWATFKDKKDGVRRKVLILEDNFPEDKNCYLLAVFTGGRVNAGTNANVGVQIYGSESSSRSHILKSSRRKVLKLNSEDWFMMQTSQPLGVIKQIHVWHDNSGTSPDWYCYKMVVYDLQTSIVYTFFVEQWLALESSEFCEAVVFPATSEDMDDIKRILIDNITFGFRNADMTGSILTRHPRSRINRLDRVAILMCFIMLALLVSLAFYKNPTDDDASAGFDNFGFSFESEDILISFQTFVISSALLLFVSVTFSKAYKPKKEQRDRANASYVYTRPVQTPTNPQSKTTTAETTPSNMSRNIDKTSFYYRLIRMLRTTFHPLPLCPVTLSESSAQLIKTNRILYIVAWFISTLLVSFCVFLITLYGLKLGQEESKQWLASTALVLVQEFLIMSPLKIVIVAFLLATTFERFVQISYYSLTVEDFLKDRQEEKELSYAVLIDKRNHPMYQPLNKMQRDFFREKQRAHTSLLNLFDLIILIAYISIICLVTSDYSIHLQSNANFHVAQMVLFKHKPHDVNFQDIRNITLYYYYLDKTLLVSLYNIKWYNHENLNNPEVKVQQRWWTMDKITKLVGPPTCRQIRVDPKKCSLNQITENSSVECIPNWSPDVEDDYDYGFGWKIPTNIKHEPRESRAWKYVLPSKSDRPYRQGASWTSYHGGGYMVSLSASDRFQTERILRVLAESKWLNQFTRVVFVDFTLFNVNMNMFTQVVLITEHFPFGLYVTRAIVNSVQLDMVYSMWKVGFILFILIILFQIVRMIRLMNRKGVIVYFSKVANIYQLFVTGLGVLSIILFVAHLKISLDYTEKFQRRGLDEFFDFDKLVYYSYISANCLTILFCCLSLRLFSVWPFGGSFPNICHTLLITGKIIISRFFVLFFLYIFVFSRLLSYLFNHMMSYSSFFWHWSKSVHNSSSMTDTIILFVVSFCEKLCLVYTLMLICYHYKQEKNKKVNQSDFIIFLKWITRQR